MTNIKYTILSIFIFIQLISSGQNNCDLSVDSVEMISKQQLNNLTTNLEAQHFETYKNKKLIPAGIKHQLICLTEDSFSIANPNESYRCCCASPKELPARKLLFFAKSKNYFLICYLTGGIGVSTTIQIFKQENEKFVDAWNGYVFNRFQSPSEVISYMKLVKKPEDDGWMHVVLMF